MRGMASSISRRGGFVPLMLALLLLSRLLIPSGYMIAPDHHGRAGLVLCAAPAAPAAGDPARHGHDGHPAPSKPGERPCPFAALTAPPLSPAPPALPPRAAAVALPLDLPPTADLPRIAPAAPPPPARGPPLSV
jgi:hypothetical protein